jgi:hypothetical protein
MRCDRFDRWISIMRHSQNCFPFDYVGEGFRKRVAESFHDSRPFRSGFASRRHKTCI